LIVNSSMKFLKLIANSVDTQIRERALEPIDVSQLFDSKLLSGRTHLDSLTFHIYAYGGMIDFGKQKWLSGVIGYASTYIPSS
jgi:hypothetical protein